MNSFDIIVPVGEKGIFAVNDEVYWQDRHSGNFMAMTVTRIHEKPVPAPVVDNIGNNVGDNHSVPQIAPKKTTWVDDTIYFDGIVTDASDNNKMYIGKPIIKDRALHYQKFVRKNFPIPENYHILNNRLLKINKGDMYFNVEAESFLTCNHSVGKDARESFPLKTIIITQRDEKAQLQEEEDIFNSEHRLIKLSMENFNSFVKIAKHGKFIDRSLSLHPYYEWTIETVDGQKYLVPRIHKRDL